MAINWDEFQKALSPVKDYESLSQRLHESFSYPFVNDMFNFTMPELVGYTQKLLGGDSKQRYTDYVTMLVDSINHLNQVGVMTIKDLIDRTASREMLEAFVNQSGVSAFEVAAILKFLLYWLIPGEKYISGLVRAGSPLAGAIRTLGTYGIRTNLQLLQAGITAEGRKTLAGTTGLAEDIKQKLVNLADFSRMPWASKATIANITGAGYESVAKLASADPDKLYADFFRYGNNIGKNLKLGNEIENSYRIARIIPVLLR